MRVPRLGTRVYGYTASSERFEGTYCGTRKVGSGYTAHVYRIIELDDGTTLETELPIYN